MAQLDKDGSLDHLDFEYLRESGAAVVGDPDRCVELAERYQASGCDLLLCLVNPYKIPHEKVMRSIELLGERVIPQFDE
jgi:alkanesulfonate monooxygenase SsuD/methylene tetrahydromethanopterin reductase-like flavin-dependent oxidoreductase (luciferase family)